jgi:hypothetical protein
LLLNRNGITAQTLNAFAAGSGLHPDRHQLIGRG